MLRKNSQDLMDIVSSHTVPSKVMSGLRLSSSMTVWLGLVAYLGVVALLITTIFPVTFVDRSQSGFFEPAGIIAMAVMGLIGVWLSTKTGFPQALQADISHVQRFVIPTIIGLSAGTLFLVTDVATTMSRLQAERFNLPSTDVAFPGSVFLYSAASIYVEIIFRLLPIPLVLWFVSNLLLRGKGQTVTFWILAILTSAIEPFTQTATQVLPTLPWLFVLAQTFGVNMAQAAIFRKYGFLAAIVVRLAFYLVYHVIGASFK